ncbi:NPCBM/NEW2 domain-containing protein [Microtetraspora niveoalba]|uniref:NPCBM/NEW2 domain-containing protein n=1 Tax=Microtetraspora niveoalba TaxID=46175 RepID=UPI00082A400B|nr:NPCBM/NEW2 domain-containing protein [Microtetraspora niveoalba]
MDETRESSTGTDSTVKVAIITAVGTLGAAFLGGVFSVLTGYLQINPSGGDPTPAATATVTVTATVTAGAAAPGPSSEPTRPEPDTSSDSPPPGESRLHLADLTPVGSAWLQGTYALASKSHEKSLAVEGVSCGLPTQTRYHLDKPYSRFRATVGVSDEVIGSARTGTVDFRVYADRDQDDRADSDEQIGARAAQYAQPNTIDIALDDTQTLILEVLANGCSRPTAVWGDPHLIP